MTRPASRDYLDAAVRDELAWTWRRCMSYIAAGSVPLADPQHEGAVRRILRAAEVHASNEVGAAADAARDVIRDRLQSISAEQSGDHDA